MSVTDFPGGITIGEGTLPIYEYDEWVTLDPVSFGTLAAGEVKVVEIAEDGCTVDFGMTVTARPNNPSETQNNHLLVMGAWSDEDGKIKLRVKNLDTSSHSFGGDQWTFTYERTFQQ